MKSVDESPWRERDYSAVMDSLIWCKFLRKAFDDFYGESAMIYERLTGWETTPDDLKLAGERINNLKKLFKHPGGLDPRRTISSLHACSMRN